MMWYDKLQAGNIAQLHTQISSCDGILERMEQLLVSFQTDLGSISSEILSLQQESVEMNLRLKNRQAVRGELSQFVDDLGEIFFNNTYSYIVSNEFFFTIHNSADHIVLISKFITPLNTMT